MSARTTPTVSFSHSNRVRKKFTALVFSNGIPDTVFFSRMIIDAAFSCGPNFFNDRTLFVLLIINEKLSQKNAHLLPALVTVFLRNTDTRPVQIT
jgi:hypothetical protein